MMTARLGPDNLSDLFGAASDVAGQADLRNVLFKVVQTAMQVTGARYGALGVVGDDGRLDEFLHMGMDEETVARIGSPPTGHSVLGTVSRGATIRLDHITDHPDSVGFPPHHPQMEGFLGVPLRTGERIFGNLYLTEKEGGFSDEDQAVVETLALIGGTAIVSNLLHARLQRAAVFDDRERIARDVHDAVIQDLFAVGLSLEGISQRIADTDARQAIANAISRLDESIASLRHFIFDLTRSDNEERPITTEVSELVQELAESYRARVDLTFSGMLGDISDRMADAVMHIVKEATSNALRHGGADSVQVIVSGNALDLRISVSDRGTGFEPEEISPGMGLGNIRQRAFDLGGTVEIHSTLGEGTMLTVNLPRRT